MNGIAKKTEYQLGGLGLASANTPEEIIGASMAKGDPGGCLGGWHLSTMAVMIAASIENAALNRRVVNLCDVIKMLLHNPGGPPPGHPTNDEIVTMLENIQEDAGMTRAPTETLPADEGDESPTAARLALVDEPTIEPDLENAEREWKAQLRRVQSIADNSVGWPTMIRFVFPHQRSVASAAKELRPGELALVEEWIEKHAAALDSETENGRFDA